MAGTEHAVAPGSPRPSPRPNPYVGPRAIRFGEAIHGRDREIAELCDILVAERIVLLYSPSGAGKSSLLEAGIRPELQRRDFRVLPTVRVRHEAREVRESSVPNRYAFSALLSLEEERPSDRQLSLDDLARTGIGDYLDQVAAETAEGLDLCVFVDQLEELFTLDPTDQDRKAEFLRELGRGLRDRGRWAVLAMREDYIAQLDPYLGLIPRRLAARCRLDLLGPAAAKVAMCRTAEDQGVRFAPEAADALVDDLRTVRVRRADGARQEFGPFVEPVQLQVVCRQLWATLPPGVDVIGPRLLASVGDVDDALATFYDERLRSVSAATGTPERELRDWFDERLVTPQGFRAQVLDGPGADGATVLRSLEDAHLIRADRRRGTEWYELAHDRLIGPLQASSARWREAHLSPLQRDAQIWERQNRRPELLLRGDDLHEAKAWAASHPGELLAVDREFLDASGRAERARLARTRRRAGAFTVLVVLLVAALVLAVAAKRSSDRARSAQRLADSQRLGLQAAAVTPADPQLGGLLALEALQRRDTPAARSGLSTALQGLDEWPAAVEVPGGVVVGAAFSADGGQFVTATGDGAVARWGTASRALERQLRAVDPAAPHHLTALALSSAGGLLATAGAATPEGDGTITVAGTDDGTRRLQLSGHAGAVHGLAFSPDGTLLASAGADGTTRLWSTTDGALVRTLTVGPGTAVRSVAFSPDSAQVATAGDDGVARLWGVVDGGLLRQLQAPGGGLMAVAYSPGGDLVVAAGADWSARSWDTRTGDLRQRYAGHLGTITAVAFSPDGEQLATSSDDRTAVVWDTDSGAALRTLTGHTEPLVSVAFAPGGPGNAAGPLLLTGSGDHTARLWRQPSGAIRHVLAAHVDERPDGQVLDGQSRGVTGLAHSTDGTVLATSNLDGTARLWDAASGGSRRVLDGRRGPLYGVAFSADGGLVAAASGDGGAVVWDVASGAERQVVGAGSPLYGVSFSPDGSLLATGGEDGVARLWSTVTGQLVAELRDRDERLNGLAFSPDGAGLATAGTDGAAIWDVRAGALERRLTGHDGEVYGVAFSPDGEQLATAGADHAVRLWDVADGTAARVYTGHTDYVFSVGFSPDGATLATASNDHSARLWDVRSGFGLGSTASEGGPIYAAAFSPDGRSWSVAAYDGTARVLTCLVCRPLEETVAAVRAQLTRPLSTEERQLYLAEE